MAMIIYVECPDCRVGRDVDAEEDYGKCPLCGKGMEIAKRPTEVLEWEKKIVDGQWKQKVWGGVKMEDAWERAELSKEREEVVLQKRDRFREEEEGGIHEVVVGAGEDEEYLPTSQRGFKEVGINDQREMTKEEKKRLGLSVG